MALNKTNKQIGDDGEDRAEVFLLKKGYEVLERNYRFGRNEIDLICLNDNLLVFVEVKYVLGIIAFRMFRFVSLLTYIFFFGLNCFGHICFGCLCGGWLCQPSLSKMFFDQKSSLLDLLKLCNTTPYP